MYSSYKLNKQGDNIQPWCTPVPILKQSVVPCKDLTATSWPSYRFLRTQVRESWNSFSEFSTVCCDHTVKGFSVVNEAEVDAVLEFLCFFYDLTDVGNLTSGCSTFSKPRFYSWRFFVHTLLKRSLKDLGHNLASMWNEWNCTLVCTFFGTALLWDWNENWPFIVLWPPLSFPNFLVYWGQQFNSIILYDLKELSWNSIASTTFAHGNAS